MLVVFESILPVFTVIMLGFGLRKSGIISADNWKIVEELAFWLLFPAILTKTLIEADFQSIQSGPFTFAIFLFLAVMGIATLCTWPVLHRLLGVAPESYSTIYQTTTRWNGFVALVIALKLYGNDSLTLMAISLALMTVVIQVSNILLLSVFTPGERPPLGKIAKMLATNPIIVSISLGAFINIVGIAVWAPIIDTLDLVGRGALGISLLTIGAGLSLAAALRPSKELLFGLFGKLVFSPAVMLGCGLLLGVSGLELSVLVLCAAVPTSMNGYLITKKMGGDAPLYAATSTVQTVVSFVSIPLALWIVQNWFGGV
jgi:predicted permease